MPSIIVRKASEETYYQLKRIASELKCNTWGELIQKLIEVYDEWKRLKQQSL